ncbi:MAG: phosphatase PAP2 family protein, partial [Dongiaceae bacterium]
MSIDLLTSQPLIPSTPSGAAPPSSRTVAALASPRRLADVLLRVWYPIGPELGRSLRGHTLFIALILLYVLAELYLPALIGVETPFLPTFSFGFFLTMSGITLAVPACLYVIYVMVAVRPQALVAYLADAVRRFLTVRRICAALPVILLFPFFGSAFAYFRILLPNFQPFAWDPAFAEWDRALHGGYDAWQLLQPVLGHPLVTAAVNGFYHLWFVVMFGVILWQAGSLARPRVRMQFFLSFILLWAVLGNLTAILLPSAGPVFYDRVTGLSNPFQPLMDYLHAANEVVPVMALNVQEQLWASYVEHGLATLGGITAMPSMHVATSLCFA